MSISKLTNNVKINRELGLDNIRTVNSHVSIGAKTNLPTKRFPRMSRELFDAPVMAFTNDMAFYLSGGAVSLRLQNSNRKADAIASVFA